MPSPMESDSPHPVSGSSLVSLQRAGEPLDSSPVEPHGPRSSAPPPVTSDDAPTIITPHHSALPSDPSLGLVPGVQLGRFEILGTIGAGGMAAVLKARDVDLGRVVALKILPPQMAKDGDNVARFKLEARAAAQLDHDNVARVFACGEDAGLNFIAFEFIEGETLRTLIERRGALPAAECVRYLLQVAAGLAHAADRGVVHRDIKPSNIIITPEGKAKIVDMGLARSVLGQGADGSVTQSGVTLGTFDYISPEQALDPRRADARSDIYSLGCTIYHAVTGRPPVPPGTAAKKLHAHQHEAVVDPRTWNPSVPYGLAVLLSQMMAKDPARRFQSPQSLLVEATKLARRLDIATEAMPQEARGLAASPAIDEPDDRPTRFPFMAIGGLAVVVLFAALFASLNDSPAGSVPTAPWKAEPVRAADPLFSAPPDRSEKSRTVATAPAPSGRVDAATTEDLLRWLNTPTVSEIRLTGTRYDLAAAAPEGVTVADRLSLTLEASAVDPPPIIKLAAAPLDPFRAETPRGASLSFARVGRLTMTNIRFELTDGPLPADPVDRPVGLLVLDADSINFRQCRFDAAADLTLADLAGLSVLRESTSLGRTSVRIENGYFGIRRGVALQLGGAISADVTECGFAPHPVQLGLRIDPVSARSETSRADLRLAHSTFMLDRGAVLDVDDGAAWAISAGYCIFAALPSDPMATMALVMDQGERRPALIRSIADRPDLRFTGRTGQPNAYFGLDALQLAGRSTTLGEARKADPPLVNDPGAEELKQPPWEHAEPLTQLSGERPWEALRLATGLEQVRATAPVLLLGVRFLPTADRRVYDPWPPGRQAPPTLIANNIKFWWPEPPGERVGNLPSNTFSRLADALQALAPGDELHIRHDGELTLPVVKLDRPGFRYLIRPAEGSTPELLVEAETVTADSSAFRLLDGELTLAGLNIRIRGDAGKAALLSLSGGRRCLLKNCLITLDDVIGENAILARIIGNDSTALRIQDTLVRGTGRVVDVQGTGSIDLDLTNTILALGGPLLSIADSSTTATTADNPSVRLNMNRVTAALAAPLLELQGGKTSVTAERSVFAPVGRTQPLVIVQGADPRQAVTWMTPAPNWYVNRARDVPYLETRTPDGDPTMTRPVDVDGWLSLTRERWTTSVGSVSFQNWPRSGSQLDRAVAEDFLVTMVDISGAMAGAAGAMPEQIGPEQESSPDER